MSGVVIKAENISKAYQLGEFSTGTLSQDIQRRWALMRGKEDPYLKIGETNDRTSKSESNIVWSLKDIDFEISQGDAVGIIGRNGAGKSTLLKVLSRVTTPTTGNIKVKGRIASLLEVGTGFHPELTGRENIFLNGAILGMRKHEIKKHFDAIVDFAGVERYIDTPVKRYSSGMYVRLAFAVAAHLESEILIVDEVLAVGDAEFQKKCLGKMGDIGKGEGRTILFVSHNMAAVRSLCTSSVILNKGKVAFQGNVGAGVKYYLDNQSGTGLLHYQNNNLRNDSGCLEIKVTNINGEITREFAYDENIIIVFKYQMSKEFLSAKISLRITDFNERIVFTNERDAKDIFKEDASVVTFKVTIPKKVLVPNKYNVMLASHIPNMVMVEQLNDVIFFEIIDTGSESYLYSGTDYGCVFLDCNWETT